MQGFGVWDGSEGEDAAKGGRSSLQQRGKADEGSEDLEGFDDLDSIVENWQKLSSLRNSGL